jgi:hypothetical protein
MKSWKLQSGGSIKFDGSFYFYVSKGGKLVNRLDSLNPYFQRAILREIGQPETAVR